MFGQWKGKVGLEVSKQGGRRMEEEEVEASMEQNHVIRKNYK